MVAPPHFFCVSKAARPALATHEHAVRSRSVATKYRGILVKMVDKTKYGEMAEWSIAAVLKTVEVKASGGSNPSLCANKSVIRISNYAFKFFGELLMHETFLPVILLISVPN